MGQVDGTSASLALLAEHRADRASTIWAVTSLASWEFHYFWPIWVIGPWGAVLLAQTRHRRRPTERRHRCDR